MKRFWRWFLEPHPIYDRIMVVFLAFIVGVYAQAGRLDTRNADDAFWLVIAVVLAFTVVVDVLSLITLGLCKLIEWRRR